MTLATDRASGLRWAHHPGGTPAELGLMLWLQAVNGLIAASLVVHAGQRWDSRTLLSIAALAMVDHHPHRPVRHPFATYSTTRP